MSSARNLATLLVTVLCTACSVADLHSSRPLEFGGGMGDLCMPAGGSADYTYGFEGLRNPGGEAITIDHVSLVRAHGVRLEEAFVAPIANMTLIGARHTWPWPNATGTDAWTSKVPANGSLLRPADGDRNLVLHIVAPRAPAGFAAVRVDYSVGARRFTAKSTTTFHIEPKCEPMGRHRPPGSVGAAGRRLGLQGGS